MYQKTDKVNIEFCSDKKVTAKLNPDYDLPSFKLKYKTNI